MIDYRNGKFFMATEQEVQPDWLVGWCNNTAAELEMAQERIAELEQDNTDLTADVNLLEARLREFGKEATQ